MQFVEERKTPKGRYVLDTLDVWHYLSTFGAIGTFSKDALANIPEGAERIYFWFKDYPTPLYLTDTVKTLGVRWGISEKDFDENPTCSKRASLKDLQERILQKSA